MQRETPRALYSERTHLSNGTNLMSRNSQTLRILRTERLSDWFVGALHTLASVCRSALVDEVQVCKIVAIETMDKAVKDEYTMFGGVDIRGLLPTCSPLHKKSIAKN